MATAVLFAVAESSRKAIEIQKKDRRKETDRQQKSSSRKATDEQHISSKKPGQH